MEIHEERPKGITIISALFLLSAGANIINSFIDDTDVGYYLLILGIIQLVISAMFYGLNRKAYFTVFIINAIALIISVGFMVKGAVQFFQSNIAFLEMLLFIPVFVLSLWVLNYLKKPDIKVLFDN